jgi:signal transduction histidine kinase
LRRDLHDELGPTLASQTFRLDAILESLDHDSTTTARLVKSLKDQNRELVADIRRLVYELRPPTLDELGLVGALAAHSGQLAHPAGLSVEVVTDPDPLGDLPAAVEVAAYRIASEACTNVVRHASASTCTIRIALADGTLTIEVSDNGVGVRSMTRSGVGMTSMRERAEELGGRFHVDRSGKGGTCVTASLPIATAAVAAAEPGTVADLLPSRGRRAVPSTGSRDG